MIRVILECGATTFHRLRYGEFSSTDSVPPEPCGPTLLHAVLARKTEGDSEEEVGLQFSSVSLFPCTSLNFLFLFQIRHNVLELLLEHYCNPLVQFKGRSAIDVAMTKSLDLLDIFIKCPKTKLNASINESNQTILVKMFSIPYFKTVASSDRLQSVCSIFFHNAILAN